MKNRRYWDEIVEAHERTVRFGLACPELPLTCGKKITDEKSIEFPNVVQNSVGILELEEIVAQCLSIHSRLKHPLEKFFGVPLLYTIGYVRLDPDEIFKQTEDELYALLKNGTESSRVNLHAWLTLPSSEIIDLSFPTSYGFIFKYSEMLGAVITSHADELRYGMSYHPMLLGDDFLRKIGGIVDVYVA